MFDAGPSVAVKLSSAGRLAELATQAVRLDDLSQAKPKVREPSSRSSQLVAGQVAGLAPCKCLTYMSAQVLPPCRARRSPGTSNRCSMRAHFLI